MLPHKLIIQYEGTDYFGWQKTKTGPSIQEALEKAVFQITREEVTIEAASRTDRGVHAHGQVVQFTLQTPKANLLHSLNGVLPPAIRVLSVTHCPLHPTLDAIGKEYIYKLCHTPVQVPFTQAYSWHVPYPLDLQKMESAATTLLGTHDFSAFANEKEKDPLCTLTSIQIMPAEISIRGNRFLYKMVRNIVGTLIYIGRGKLNDMETILISRDRKKAGITAPAHGLYLSQVFYPQGVA